MEGDEVKCADARVNEVKFDAISKTQEKLLENQNEHNTRLRILEENKIQMTSEFANLKQSQSDQKVLMLELDKSAREKNDKMFDKIITAQAKIEEKNDAKFVKMADGQDTILTKLTELHSSNAGKIEITKGKIIMWTAIIVAILTIFPPLIIGIFL